MPYPDYRYQFSHLRVDRSRGIAPHKPVLLLAVLDNIERGLITDNRVIISPELVATFMEVWAMLVKEGPYAPRFALPFFHLKSEGFWTLVPFPGAEPAVTSSGSIRSFSNLKDTVAWAVIAPDLFAGMCVPVERERLRSVLLETYFPLTRENYRQQRGEEGTYLQELELQALGDHPQAAYSAATATEEEEIFLRSSAFRKVVPRAYQYTCCISGLRIVSGSMTFVDACHIVPFSISHDDTIGNGLSLCPNLHRAFDRHLICIDHEYRVRMKFEFFETADTDYGIKKYEGRSLLLPAEKKYWPAQENLTWHREWSER